jgi:hypothetical protein
MHFSMSKTSEKLLKIAQTFEKKYKRVDQDPDTLNPDEIDPQGFLYPSYDGEEGDGNPRVSDNVAQSLFTQVYDHYLALNEEEQKKFLHNLTNIMKKV